MGVPCLARSQVPDPPPLMGGVGSRGLANHIVGTNSPGTRSPSELVVVGTLPKPEPPGTSQAAASVGLCEVKVGLPGAHPCTLGH